MKKNLLVFTILISMFSVINVSQANANCTAGDPCGTWAMLDSQGVVTNVIVCQASVCGGGTWAGQTVVPQVAPNPVTNNTHETGSYIGNSQDNSEVRYSDGTFTINENVNISKTLTEIDNNTTTISKVEIPVSTRSFTYEDTINKKYNEIEMDIVNFNENLPTTLEIIEISPIGVNEENNILYNTIQESTVFNERKNLSEVTQNLSNNNLNLLLSKIQTLVFLLGSWVK